MRLPALEAALVGILIAEKALDAFVAQTREVVARIEDGEEVGRTRADYLHLRDLVGIEEEDAVAWRWQLRQWLSIMESIMHPTRVERAKQARLRMLRAVAGK